MHDKAARMTATRSESAAHRALKRAAALWAQEQGFNLVAEDVRIPRSSYRADVVAADSTLVGGPRIQRTAVFECKQARSDLLKDSREVLKTTQRIAELSQRKHELDRLLGLHYPSLRTSDELFAEFVVPVDVGTLGHEGYAAVVRELDQLQNRLYGKTKFDRLFTRQCVDFHYLVVQPGILQPHEVPQGWGLLVWNETLDSLSLDAQPTLCQPSPAHRLELILGIARTATRWLNKEHQGPSGGAD